MVKFDLNLSTRPFPAYRLTSLILAGVFAVLAVLSVVQTAGFMHYSKLAGEVRQTERNVRVESESLARRLADLESHLNTPAATAKLTEIDYLNGLIARRRFSWTQVFGELEHLLPNAVHLTTLRPDITGHGPIVMHMDVRGQNIEVVSQFINALEKAPAFENVVVSVEEKRDPSTSPDVDVALTVNYFPERENQ